jgi:hypothetical protein
LYLRSDDANKGNERNVDILDDSAMENALNICHNVQVDKTGSCLNWFLRLREN